MCSVRWLWNAAYWEMFLSWWEVILSWGFLQVCLLILQYLINFLSYGCPFYIDNSAMAWFFHCALPNFRPPWKCLQSGVHNLFVTTGTGHLKCSSLFQSDFGHGLDFFFVSYHNNENRLDQSLCFLIENRQYPSYWSTTSLRESCKKGTIDIVYLPKQ